MTRPGSTSLALLFALASAPPAWSLGLGDITVFSLLGEPFHGEARVFGAGVETLAPSCVRLLPDDIQDLPGLAAAGGQARAYLSAGSRLVLLTAQPVNEPVVVATVEVGCQSPVRRRYTLLLDPMGAGGRQPGSLSVPIPAPLQPTPEPRPSPRPTEAPRSAPIPVAASGAGARPAPGQEELDRLRREVAEAGARAEQALFDVPVRDDTFYRSVHLADRLTLPSGREVRTDLVLQFALELGAREPDSVNPARTAVLGEVMRQLAGLGERRMALEAILDAAGRGTPVAGLRERLDALAGPVPAALAPASSPEDEGRQPGSDGAPPRVPQAGPEADSEALQSGAAGLPWWSWGGLGLVALLLLFLLWLRRRQPVEEETLPADPVSIGVYTGAGLHARKEEHYEDIFADMPSQTGVGEGATAPVAGDVPGQASLNFVKEDVEVSLPEPVVTVAPDEELARDLSGFEHDDDLAGDMEGNFDADQLVELAEVMLAFGRAGPAADTLRELVEKRPDEAVEPWLKLLKICHDSGDRDDFDSLSRRINKVFNVRPPRWEDFDVEEVPVDLSLPDERDFGLVDFDAPVDDTAPLESMQHIVGQLQKVWGTDEASRYLEHLLRDNRNGLRQGFGLDVVQDIVLLKAVARLLDQERPRARAA